MPRPMNLPHTAGAPSECKPSYVRRSYSRTAVLSIMIVMYSVGAQGTLLSQNSVRLNITVAVKCNYYNNFY